ncbi:MAG: hypothetical protein IKZ07_04000 [Akkermansia sp.]|nr:hypothetical protein [Akkermansia sp.]
MKKTLVALLCAVSSLSAETAQSIDSGDVSLPIAPDMTMQKQMSWYDIDAGVRTYLILLLANSIELGQEADSSPEAQFDIMQKIMDITPLDSLSGEYLAFVKEANIINTKIVNALRAEKPTNVKDIVKISARFDGELEALYAKYPLAAEYFRKDAQMGISLMILQEAEIVRVSQQAAMAGKSPQEINKTVIEHLRRVAADQQ